MPKKSKLFYLRVGLKLRWTLSSVFSWNPQKSNESYVDTWHHLICGVPILLWYSFFFLSSSLLSLLLLSSFSSFFRYFINKYSQIYLPMIGLKNIYISTYFLYRSFFFLFYLIFQFTACDILENFLHFHYVLVKDLKDYISLFWNLYFSLS